MASNYPTVVPHLVTISYHLATVTNHLPTVNFHLTMVNHHHRTIRIVVVHQQVQQLSALGNSVCDVAIDCNFHCFI